MPWGAACCTGVRRPVVSFLLGAAYGGSAMGLVWLLQRSLGSVRVERMGCIQARRYLEGIFLMFLFAWIEEMIFRLAGVGLLSRYLPVGLALALSSLLFGAMHIFNGHYHFLGLANTAVVGLVLGLAYLRWESLWLVTGIHFAWNFLQWNVFGYPLYGRNSHRYFPCPWATHPRGAAWLSGGEFGAEGSILTTLAWVVFGFLWYP